MTTFDYQLLIKRKNLAAAHMHSFNFIQKEVVSRLLERIDEIKQPFVNCLDLGASLGEIAEQLQGSKKITNVIQVDYAYSVLKHNPFDHKLCVNFASLPFKNNSFDIIVSCFALHNLNNLDQVIKEATRVLKPGGLFLLSMPTIGSLSSLEDAFMQAELQLYGTASARVHPFTDIKTLGNLFQSTGLGEIVADLDSIEIMYSSFKKIITDLRGLGENNLLQNRSTAIMSPAFFAKVEEILSQHKEDNHFPIKVNFANVLGWKQTKSLLSIK